MHVLTISPEHSRDDRNFWQEMYSLLSKLLIIMRYTAFSLRLFRLETWDAPGVASVDHGEKLQIAPCFTSPSRLA